MAGDASGNTYLTGSRAVVVELPAGYGVPFTDSFVSELDRSGNLTLLATISGKAYDRANAIALGTIPAGDGDYF